MMLRILKQFQLKVKVKVKVKIVILKRKKRKQKQKRKKTKNGLILYGNILHVYTRLYTFLHIE